MIYHFNNDPLSYKQLVNLNRRLRRIDDMAPKAPTPLKPPTPKPTAPKPQPTPTPQPPPPPAVPETTPGHGVDLGATTTQEENTDNTSAVAVVANEDSIDVFVCIYEPDFDKNRAAIASWKEAEATGHIRLLILVPLSDGVTGNPDFWASGFGVNASQIAAISFTGREFQRGRRIAAENMAKSDYYIVADGDCVYDGPEPVLADGLATAWNVMDDHPEFGMLSFMPSNANIVQWTPDSDVKNVEGKTYDTINNHDVMEHVDVGGIRMVRINVMPKAATAWDQQLGEEAPWRYDRQHAEQLRQRGYRVGYFRHVTMKHLGEATTPNSGTPA